MINNINQTPEMGNNSEKKRKIKSYEEWRETAGSDDKYGHYAEYVTIETLGFLNVNCRKATKKEDSPGGGDIVMWTSQGRIVFVDVKLWKPWQEDKVVGRVHSETEGELNIHPHCVERLRSNHRETQIELLSVISNLLVAMDEKYDENNDKRQ